MVVDPLAAAPAVHAGGIMKVLVLNTGSSSIKYRVFLAEGFKALAWGVLERVGEPMGRLSANIGGREADVQERPVPEHRAGLEWILHALASTGVLAGGGGLMGIGHRVVHGADAFTDPVLIDDSVIRAIKDAVPPAPPHNPPNLTGIEVARELCPGVPQVAVFDTAFHQSMPPHAYRYAVPHELYARGRVRRYGFHGTSHQYVANRAAEYLKRPPHKLNLITLHLGGGSSAAAILAGRSVDTSMGMTPLEGLVMGTRSGDLDPALTFYLQRQMGMSAEVVEDMLFSQSGLKGVCGTGDMRDVLRLAGQEGEAAERARLALDMYSYRVRKYIGAYMAVLGRLDAVVFTGGVGQNSPKVRRMCCQGMEGLGIMLDEERNKAKTEDIFEIQAPEAAIRLLVVPTNEELQIARNTVRLVRALKS